MSKANQSQLCGFLISLPDAYCCLSAAAASEEAAGTGAPNTCERVSGRHDNPPQRVSMAANVSGADSSFQTFLETALL